MIGALIAAALALSTATTAAPAPREPRVTIPYDGPEIFARLLDHVGLSPLSSSNWLELHASETVIIVFGDYQPLLTLDKRPGGLKRLLDAGASLCIATDRRFNFEVLETLKWNVSVDGTLMVSPRSNYDRKPACPLIWISKNGNAVTGHPVFKGVNLLAANAPSKFTPSEDRSAPEILAFLTPDSHSEPRSRGSIGFGFYPVIRGSPANAAQRVLLVAGHGVFMNCMTIQDDTEIQNRRFALNVARWLAGEEPAKKRYALFYHEGKLRGDFRMPLIGPPTLPLPSAAALNKIINAVEKEGLVQRLIDENVPQGAILHGVVVFGTLVVLLFGLKRFFQSRHAPERTPLLVGIPDARTTPLVHQQMREVTSRNQLFEPAQALAQTWLRDVARVDPRALEATYEIRASYFARRKLRRQLDEIGKLAGGDVSGPWTRKRLLELARTLEDLTGALVAGEVRFVSAAPAAGT